MIGSTDGLKNTPSGSNSNPPQGENNSQNANNNNPSGSGGPHEFQNAIHKVSIRVPPFWKPDPTLWFCQLEAQFAISGIVADGTKFNTVVAHIESDILASVGDIIRNPPQLNKYDTLKNRLIHCHSDSEESRLKKLFNKCYLGDRRPSELYRQMQNLAGTDGGTQLLKSLWLQKLPQQIQMVLSSFDDEDTTIDKLIRVADRCNDNVHGEAVNMISENRSKSEISELKVQVSELCKKVDQLSTHNRSRNRKSDNSPHPRKTSRSKTPTSKRLCWYHRRFSEKATKCVSPCTFTSETKNE